jgi:hypothetical protein
LSVHLLAQRLPTTGLAINPTSNQALMFCKTFVMSLNLTTAKSEKFAQVLGGDIVNYDAKVDQFFVGSPHITRPSVVGIFGGNPIAYYSSVSTDAHGNSAAYDETNNVVYTPNLLPDKAGVSSFRLPDKPQLLRPGPRQRPRSASTRRFSSALACSSSSSAAQRILLAGPCRK